MMMAPSKLRKVQRIGGKESKKTNQICRMTTIIVKRRFLVDVTTFDFI